MIKVDLARNLSEKLNVTQKDVDDYLNAFMEIVGETLEKGEKVQLAGFGVFVSRYVPEHQGRNPKTGESLIIPGSYYPIFKPGKGLKCRVANCKRTQFEVNKAKSEQVKPAAPAVKTSCKKKSNSPQANV